MKRQRGPLQGTRISKGRMYMAEVASPVLGLSTTLSSEVDDHLEVLRLKDLARAVLAELDGLSVLEQQELGRAVSWEEGDSGSSRVDGVGRRQRGVAADRRANDEHRSVIVRSSDSEKGRD